MSADAAPELRHIVVAAGTPAEWATLEEQDWVAMLDGVGKVADQVGATGWCCVRSVGCPSPRPDGASAGRAAAWWWPSRSPTVGCAWPPCSTASGVGGGALTQAAVDAVINAPAGADPDLVVVLGPSHRLPASLVWELAYSELVFIDIPWLEASAPISRMPSAPTPGAIAASAAWTDGRPVASHLYHDTTVVLRTYKLGEADRIIVLLTEDHGKVRAVAKGVRKTMSKFGARLEPVICGYCCRRAGSSTWSARPTWWRPSPRWWRIWTT